MTEHVANQVLHLQAGGRGEGSKWSPFPCTSTHTFVGYVGYTDTHIIWTSCLSFVRNVGYGTEESVGMCGVVQVNNSVGYTTLLAATRSRQKIINPCVNRSPPPPHATWAVSSRPFAAPFDRIIHYMGSSSRANYIIT